MMMEGTVPVPKATVMTMETAKMRTPSAAARVAEKDACGESMQCGAEALSDELIGRHELAFKVARQEEHANDDAAEQVADSDLQEAEVAGVGEARDADDGERAGFGGDDGERDGPPGDIAISEEVGAQRALSVPEAEAEPGDAQQIEDDRGDVDEVELHRMRFLGAGSPRYFGAVRVLSRS